MKFIPDFFYWIKSQHMDTPTNWSSFHMVFFFLMIAVTVLLCVFFKKCSEKTERIIIGSFWGLLVLTETTKLIIYGLNFENGVYSYDFAYWAFPFQLCSTPLYVLPLVAFLKNGKIRDCAIAFSALFAIFGGVAVMIYPGDVFTIYTFINHQTMIHHSTQIITGVFLGVRYLKDFSWKFYLKAVALFAVLSSIALALNFGLHLKGHTVNMFFLSPYCEGAGLPPVLCNVYPLVPYPVYLLAYLIGFGIVAGIIYWIFNFKVIINGVKKLISKITAKKENA